MVYLFGIGGFIGGFVLGQLLLSFLLRHKTREELLSDKALKWKYGTLNWLVAAMGCASALMLHEKLFVAGP